MSTAPFTQPALLPGGSSVTGAPIQFIGKQMLVKVSSQTTGGEFTLLEDVSPALSGPPLHAHTFEEWFYILEGEFLFETDGRQFRAVPGDTVYAPANLPHTFQNISQADGRMLILARPGGVELYFQDLAERMMSDPANVPALAAIGARYGVKVLGPPLAARKT